ncbi:hypothetical protein Tco_0397775 [Tanacetum coccineum]
MITCQASFTYKRIIRKKGVESSNHQFIMATLAENVLAAGMLLDSILKGPFEFKVVMFPANEATGRPAETRMQKDLTHKERIKKECDIQAGNMELMEGTELTKQERESKLADEFDRLTSNKGETIHSYYMSFAKLMNDINIIGLKITTHQVNTKFVNHLQPEWSRFMTRVKQAKNLHEVSFDQLYAYLKQNELDLNEVRDMNAIFLYPLALIANTYNPPPSYSSYKSQYNPQVPVDAQQQPYNPQLSYQSFAIYQQPSARPTSPDSRFVVPTFLPIDDPIASLNKAMIFLTTAISSRYPPTNNQLRTSSSPRTQANTQDGRVCTTKKRVKDSEWFKEKMLLAQQQDEEIEIDAEQQDFLANGLEGFDSDCEDLQLNTTSILMIEKVDAYDSEVDDAPTTNAIFMAKLSPAGSINRDEVGPSYDSDILTEVPNYDTYHANDMINPFVQEFPDSE